MFVSGHSSFAADEEEVEPAGGDCTAGHAPYQGGERGRRLGDGGDAVGEHARQSRGQRPRSGLERAAALCSRSTMARRAARSTVAAATNTTADESPRLRRIARHDLTVPI